MNVVAGQIYEVHRGYLESVLHTPGTRQNRARPTADSPLPKCVIVLRVGGRSVIGDTLTSVWDHNNALVGDLYAGRKLGFHPVTVDRVLAAVRSGAWIPAGGNPCAPRYLRREEIPPEKKVRYERVLDEYQELLRPLRLLAAAAFEPDQRTKVTRSICDATDNKRARVAASHITELFLKLVRSGGNELALLPANVSAGRPSFAILRSNDVRLPSQRSGPVRRRAVIARKNGDPNWQRFNGFVLDEPAIAKIARGLKKYLFTPDSRGPGKSICLRWTAALKQMRADPECLARVTYRDQDGNRVRTVIPLPKPQGPSIDQLKTVARLHHDIFAQIEAILGPTNAARNLRPLKSDTRAIAGGPGVRYDIDWTLADVWLVSDIDGLPCGRPWVCFVRDLWSRAIVGVWVTFNNPDYRESAMAVYVACSDKRAYFNSLGLDKEIPPEMVPFVGVPGCIGADNGELANKLSDAIARNIADLQFLPKHRPDLKPIVEGGFHLSRIGLVRFIPGQVAKHVDRDDTQPRNAATVSVREFTRELVLWVFRTFNQKPIRGLRMDADERAARLLPVPLKRWKWGVANRSGELPIKSDEELIAKCLPRDSKAIFNRRGLWFRGCCYDRPDDAGFQNFKLTRRPKQSVSFDENNTNFVWLWQDGIPSHVPLSEHTREFRDRTFREVKLHLERLSLDIEIAKDEVDLEELDQLSRIFESQRLANRGIRENYGSVAQRNKVSRAVGVEQPRAAAAAAQNAVEREMVNTIAGTPPVPTPVPLAAPSPNSTTITPTPRQSARWSARLAPRHDRENGTSKESSKS